MTELNGTQLALENSSQFVSNQVSFLERLSNITAVDRNGTVTLNLPGLTPSEIIAKLNEIIVGVPGNKSVGLGTLLQPTMAGSGDNSLIDYMKDPMNNSTHQIGCFNIDSGFTSTANATNVTGNMTMMSAPSGGSGTDWATLGQNVSAALVNLAQTLIGKTDTLITHKFPLAADVVTNAVNAASAHVPTMLAKVGGVPGMEHAIAVGGLAVGLAYFLTNAKKSTLPKPAL